jgi:hypothetical protein
LLSLVAKLRFSSLSADGEDDGYATTMQNKATARVGAYATTQQSDSNPYSTTLAGDRSTTAPSFMALLNKQMETKNDGDAYSTTIVTNNANSNSNNNSPNGFATTIMTNNTTGSPLSIPRRSPNLNDSTDQPKLKKRENQRNLAALVEPADASMVDLDEEATPKNATRGNGSPNALLLESPVAQTSNSTVLNRKKQCTEEVCFIVLVFSFGLVFFYADELVEALASANGSKPTQQNEHARLLGSNGEANVINEAEEDKASACCGCTLF